MYVKRLYPLAGTRQRCPRATHYARAARSPGSERGMLLRRLGLAGAGRRRSPAARGLASGAPREAADAVVVGAGVVGLAVARALAMAGREVVVVEAAPSFGTGTSSRNSEVIHAGIYYPPRSLKVRAPSCHFPSPIQHARSAHSGYDCARLLLGRIHPNCVSFLSRRVVDSGMCWF